MFIYVFIFKAMLGALFKTIPRCLQRITFSLKPFSIPLLINLSWQIFLTLIAYAYCMGGGWKQVADDALLHTDVLHPVTMVLCQ